MADFEDSLGKIIQCVETKKESLFSWIKTDKTDEMERGWNASTTFQIDSLSSSMWCTVKKTSFLYACHANILDRMGKIDERKQKPFQFLLFICKRKSHECSLSSWLSCWWCSIALILVKRKITCDISTFTMFIHYICKKNTHKHSHTKPSGFKHWMNSYESIWSSQAPSVQKKPIENGIELKCGYSLFFFLFCPSPPVLSSSVVVGNRSPIEGKRRLACCVHKIVGFYEIIHKFYIFRMQIRTDVHSIRLHV